MAERKNIREEENESYLDRLEREGAENAEKKPKKKRFRLFDTQREGKGVSKDEKKYPPDLRGFWQSYRWNFGRLLSVNILMIVGNFPLIFLIAGNTSFTKIAYAQPVSLMNQVLSALQLAEPVTSPSTLVRISLEGLKQTGYAFTPWTYVLLGIGCLILFTFGLTNAGTAYILRNMITGEPVFMVSDFFYAIKRNWKQALPYGILDCILILLIPFNILTTLQNKGGYFNGLLLWANILFGLLYFFMRFYIYLQMVTFDLSVFKILKNSLIFAFLGIKRNLMALLGILLVVGLNLFLLTASQITMALGVILPFVLTLSHCSFISTYAAYFKMKELMIDPYVKPEEGAHTAPDLPDLS